MEATHHEGKIKVSGSMQCPGYVSDALEQASGEKIEVEQTPTGGGFGGKEDYPSLIAIYAYLLALKSQKNVRLIYERSEDIAYTTKRHPAHIAYRGAINKEGRIQSLSVRFEIDGGAYCTLSPVVLSRGALHCCGLYDIPAIDVLARAMATNTPPSGAFRGFGAPQALFGIERYMDDLALWLGSDPLTIRRQHLPHSVSTTLTDAPIREADALCHLLETAIKKSNYEERYQEIKENSKKERHGIGFALFMHGGGFTGSGEKMLASRVRLEVLKDGSVHIQIINTEMGQGATTVLPKIVADELGIDSKAIHYTTPNTFTCAASGPTVASRTTMVIGNLLRNAAHQLKQALLPYSNSQEFSKAAEHYLARGGSAIFEAIFEQPKNIVWDDEHYKGEAYLGYSLGCYVAEVAIDPISYRARVLWVYALNDIALPVNEILAESQVQGGVVQGVGYALQEELLYHEGRILNGRLSDYMIPTAADAPRMEIEFMKNGSTPKGLGELPMSGTGAAIANAVSNALGVSITSLPITPYTIMKVLQ
jgi:CO/xanthine dehydrogenase Mo-binding subunit